MMEPKLVLVSQKTRLEELIYRFNTEGQVRFYLEHHGADYGEYLREHQRYTAAVQTVQFQLEEIGRVQRIDRSVVSRFLFGPEDVVVCVGRDGLVANVLKYLTVQPLVGVNPDPDRWDGVLLPFRPEDMKKLLPEVCLRRRACKQITLAQAQLSDGQQLLAVNDLFIGRRTHASARYTLRCQGKAENQSSSGIIVSTGLGSTGWLKSVLAGAAGVARFYGGAAGAYSGSFAWDARELRFAVREPYPSRSTGAELVFGRIAAGQQLEIMSQMPEDGVIFSDGMEADSLEFTAGITASIGIAKTRGKLVV